MGKDINEGNKIIAVFMGATENMEQMQISTIGKTKVPTGRMYHPNRFPDNMHTCSVQDLKYPTSWDWLMPVVEKIRDEKDFGSIDITINYLFNLNNQLSMNHFNSIGQLWQVVVKLIQRLNQHPTNP